MDWNSIKLIIVLVLLTSNSQSVNFYIYAYTKKDIPIWDQCH
jgi:hypothetical protein